MRGCFVTGTDTGVGKTLAASALLYALQPHYRRVVGMKPVAAGAVRIASEMTNEDVLELRAASNICVAPELDNPVLLPDPVSPQIAAQRAGRLIDVTELARRYRQLQRRADFVVVEGAGGFHVPLSEMHTGADLALALALPVVLVVGLRLGCLNHALLTAEAIRERDLEISGWIANRIDPDMQAQKENIEFLKRRLRAPLLADIPYRRHAKASEVADLIELPLSWRNCP